MKTCKDCGNPAIHSRGRCYECYKAYNRNRQRKYFAKNKDWIIERICTKKTCVVCGKPLLAWRTTQKYHAACRSEYAQVKRLTEKRPRKRLNGYWVVYKPESQAAFDNRSHRGYVYEHRDIAEGVLGRALKSGEVVHHIDGDKLNNAHSNLVIMERREHTRMHRIQRSNV